MVQIRVGIMVNSRVSFIIRVTTKIMVRIMLNRVRFRNAFRLPRFIKQ